MLTSAENFRLTFQSFPTAVIQPLNQFTIVLVLKPTLKATCSIVEAVYRIWYSIPKMICSSSRAWCRPRKSKYAKNEFFALIKRTPLHLFLEHLHMGFPTPIHLLPEHICALQGGPFTFFEYLATCFVSKAPCCLINKIENASLRACIDRKFRRAMLHLANRHYLSKQQLAQSILSVRLSSLCMLDTSVSLITSEKSKRHRL